MNKELVSVRVDPEVLKYISEFCSRNGRSVGTSRSDVINWALTMAVEYHKLNHCWLGRGFFSKRGDKITKFDVDFEKGSWSFSVP